MSRKSRYSELLGSNIHVKKPLWVVELDLEPAKETSKTDSVRGGWEKKPRDPMYDKLNNDLELRRQFIKALHLGSNTSWAVLRNIFLNCRVSLMKNSELNYSYLDGVVDEHLGGETCMMVEFPMLSSRNIDQDMKVLHKKSKSKSLVYKTHSAVNEFIRFWYKFVGIDVVDLTDEVKAIKAAGFQIEYDVTPVEDNPLGIKYLILK